MQSGISPTQRTLPHSRGSSQPALLFGQPSGLPRGPSVLPFCGLFLGANFWPFVGVLLLGWRQGFANQGPSSLTQKVLNFEGGVWLGMGSFKTHPSPTARRILSPPGCSSPPCCGTASGCIAPMGSWCWASRSSLASCMTVFRPPLQHCHRVVCLAVDDLNLKIRSSAGRKDKGFLHWRLAMNKTSRIISASNLFC